MNSVFYPGDKNQYLTLEVIKPNDKERLDLIVYPKPVQNHVKHDDIVDKMRSYLKLQYQLMIKNALGKEDANCPA